MKNFTDYQDFEMKPNAGYAAALGATEAFKKQWQKKLKASDASLSVVEKQHLHSMQLWLAVLHEVAETIGPKACVDIGKSVAKNIELPYDADTIQKALAHIDLAYHENHSFQGDPLFDTERGLWQEGIGHFEYEIAHERGATLICDTPYPCDLELGLISGIAERFEPKARVQLDLTEPSRKSGAEATVYHISW